MSQQKKPLQKLAEFFVARFIVTENSLWRVLQLIAPMKYYVICANVLLTIASIIGSFILVSLLPLFQFTLDPGHAKSPLFNPQTQVERSHNAHGHQEAAKAHKAKMLDHFPALQRGQAWVEKKAEHYRKRYAAALEWGRNNQRPFVLITCGILILMLVVQGMIQFAGDRMMGKVSITVTCNLLRDVYGRVLDQEMKFFDQTSIGTLINTCYREVFEMRNIITFLASTRLMLPIQMFMLFCTLLIISVKFTLLLCCLLPLVILPTMILTRSLKRAIREMMQGEARPIDIMTEAFHGIRAIKTFSAEEYEKGQMNPAVADYEAFANKRRSSQAMIEPTVDILNTLVIMLVFAAICLFLPTGGEESKAEMSSKLLAFMVALQRFYKPFRQLMTMNLSMQRSAMAARRIFTLLDRKPEIVDAPDAVDFPAEWNEIRFDNVHLAYQVFFKGQPRHRPALRGVNLRIERGESIAFVGPNGAGKSSLVNLLCRLYDPTHGAIYFDDVPLTRIRMKSLREKVCLITQQPILFNRSVSENIAFGLDGISQERIEEAARTVNAHQFIMNLPDGYDSLVGETGKLLSGGERQKIVLARAFVRNPDLVIFDEPTTGLDKETTQEFLELISQLRQRRMTIIYITHEQTHLRRFERILQLTPEKKILEVTPEAAAAMLRDTAKAGA